MPDNHQQVLYTALEDGNVEQLRELLQSNRSLSNVANADKLPPAHVASERNSLEGLQVLLEFGADVQSRDMFGNTPLHYAVQHSPPTVAELLIQHGADVEASNSANEKPLHVAAQFDNHAAVRLLLDLGTDVNARGANDWTPLHYAAWHGAPESAFLLIVRGANLDARDSDDHTPLHLSLRYNYIQGWAVLGMLIQKTRSLDIYTAIGLGMTYIVRCLLADNPGLLKTDPNAQDWLPLATAAGNLELVQLLLANGADANTCRSFRLPLIEAMGIDAAEKRLHLLQTLLHNGADPRRKPAPEKESPLEWAQQNAPNFVELLSHS